MADLLAVLADPWHSLVSLFALQQLSPVLNFHDYSSSQSARMCFAFPGKFCKEMPLDLNWMHKHAFGMCIGKDVDGECQQRARPDKRASHVLKYDEGQRNFDKV